MNTPPPVATLGSIARRFGVSPHQVRWVVASRGIQPCGRAGNARVFSDVDVERIGRELARIARRKEAVDE